MYIFFASCFLVFATVDASLKQLELIDQYKLSCDTYSDIYEHIPLLRELANECDSVTEIGLRNMISTWGILFGLSENSSGIRKYVGVDIVHPPRDSFNLAKSLAKRNKISFNFIEADDMTIDLQSTDMLFIDSLHTYCHLTYELEKFSSLVSKYIVMHDTDDPWGFRDDIDYYGDRTEYPVWIDKNKRGLLVAVMDFLKGHPEWVLKEMRCNNHGLTVLKRERP